MDEQSSGSTPVGQHPAVRHLPWIENHTVTRKPCAGISGRTSDRSNSATPTICRTRCATLSDNHYPAVNAPSSEWPPPSNYIRGSCKARCGSGHQLRRAVAGNPPDHCQGTPAPQVDERYRPGPQPRLRGRIRLQSKFQADDRNVCPPMAKKRGAGSPKRTAPHGVTLLVSRL